MLKFAIGSSVRQKKGSDRKPLMVAAERGYGDIVKMLHESGADINAQDKSCRTALNLAKTNGRADIVDYLTTLRAK